MYGPDLTRIVLDAGFTRDSVEKVKTGLKKQEVLVKEPETGSWALAPRFVDLGAAVPAHSTPRIEDPQDTRVSRIILEALTAAGEAGLAGGALVEAARSRGIPRSKAAATRQSLRAAGLIECDLAHGALADREAVPVTDLRNLLAQPPGRDRHSVTATSAPDEPALCGSTGIAHKRRDGLQGSA